MIIASNAGFARGPADGSFRKWGQWHLVVYQSWFFPFSKANDGNSGTKEN